MYYSIVETNIHMHLEPNNITKRYGKKKLISSNKSKSIILMNVGIFNDNPLESTFSP